jgi:hypothetical protein
MWVSSILVSFSLNASSHLGSCIFFLLVIDCITFSRHALKFAVAVSHSALRVTSLISYKVDGQLLANFTEFSICFVSRYFYRIQYEVCNCLSQIIFQLTNLYWTPLQQGRSWRDGCGSIESRTNCQGKHLPLHFSWR